MKLYARRGFEWAEDGLVGLWSPVSTGATQGMLLDCNPSTNNHGTLTGYTNLNTGWVGSQYGTVSNFDGANNYAATSAWRGMSRDYSASFWFRTNFSTVGVTCMLASSFDGFGAHLLGVRGTEGALYAYAGTEVFFGSGYNDGRWNFATITRQFGIIGLGTIFANGVLLGSANIGLNDPAGGPSWRIGGTPRYGANFLGQIGNVVFHGRLLSLIDHQQAFQAGPGGMWQERPRRSRAYFGAAGFKAYWARRQAQLIGGGL